MNMILTKSNYTKLLSVFLWLVALHSMMVGIGLILLPASLIEFSGFAKCTERFFPSQGGVFHIAMAVGYAIAAYNIKRFECLVIFSIIVKFIATLFLLIYFVFVSSIWLVGFSCISDFIMGLIILWLLISIKKQEKL